MISIRNRQKAPEQRVRRSFRKRFRAAPAGRCQLPSRSAEMAGLFQRICQDAPDQRALRRRLHRRRPSSPWQHPPPAGAAASFRAALIPRQHDRRDQRRDVHERVERADEPPRRRSPRRPASPMARRQGRGRHGPEQARPSPWPSIRSTPRKRRQRRPPISTIATPRSAANSAGTARSATGPPRAPRIPAPAQAHLQEQHQHDELVDRFRHLQLAAPSRPAPCPRSGKGQRRFLKLRDLASPAIVPSAYPCRRVPSAFLRLDARYAAVHRRMKIIYVTWVSFYFTETIRRKAPPAHQKGCPSPDRTRSPRSRFFVQSPTPSPTAARHHPRHKGRACRPSPRATGTKRRSPSRGRMPHRRVAQMPQKAQGGQLPRCRGHRGKGGSGITKSAGSRGPGK